MYILHRFCFIFKAKKRPSMETKCSSPCSSSTNEFHLDSTLCVENLNIHIKVSDLEQIRVLGKGQYVVNEMKHKPSGHRFAVKVRNLIFEFILKKNLRPF